MSDIYLHLDGKQTGPYQRFQVRRLVTEGKISPETLAWYEGLGAWSTVATVLATDPPPAPARRPARGVRAEKEMNGFLLAAIIGGCVLGAIFVFSCLAGIALGPITSGIKMAQESGSMQTSRTIELAMTEYAQNHHGVYPDGKTSTEVFQKLLDGKYISDPGVFYLAMPGKTKATSSTLTSNNVCYDVTSGVTADSSGSVPVVFCTGYTITYAPGTNAIRESATSTPFPGPGLRFIGLAVAYKNYSARFLHGDADGTIHDFVPGGFDAGGKTYQQLRP